LFSIVIVPGEVYYEASEITNYYLPLLERGIYSWNPIDFQMGMPLYFNTGIFFMDAFNLSSVEVVIYLRMVIFLATLYIVREVSRLLCRIHGLSFRIVPVIAILIISFDYVVSYLAFGDQFKNILGVPFYLLFLYHAIKNNRIFSLIFGLLSVASHFVFFFILIVSWISWVISKNDNIIKGKNIFIVIFLVFIFILIIQNIPMGGGLTDKLNYSKSVLGFLSAFLYSPGVILASVYYFSVIYLLMKDKDLIKASRFFRFSIIMIVLFFIGSKVNIFGISFVEPTRMYLAIAPLIALSLSMSMRSRWIAQYKKIFFSHIIYNLTLFEFSKQSRGLVSYLIDIETTDIFKSFGNSETLIFYVFYVFFVFGLIFFMRRVVKLL
jgi:hypothetical protein